MTEICEHECVKRIRGYLHSPVDNLCTAESGSESVFSKKETVITTMKSVGRT